MLDAKAAQNLSILLGGPLKHMSYEDVKRAVLRCDEEVLSETLTESLIQYCPTPDQFRKLENYRAEYDDLAEAEQFAITVSRGGTGLDGREGRGGDAVTWCACWKWLQRIGLRRKHVLVGCCGFIRNAVRTLSLLERCQVDI